MELAPLPVAINLAWPADTTLFAVAERHVVRPWLLLPKAQGYWAGAENAVAFCAAAGRLMDAWGERPPSTLIVDLEPPYARITAIEAALRARPPRYAEALAALRDAPSAACVRAAEREYTRLVHAAHARGWRVHLTTLPFVLDGGTRQRRVRDFLGLPVDGPDWDLVTVQAYRTLFADFGGRVLGPLGRAAFGPRVVYEYGLAVRAAFGERGGLDLGLVGAGVFPARTYRGPEDLGRDLAAAQRAGVPASNTHIFDLGGMLRRGLDDWLNATRWQKSIPGRPSRRDLGTPLVRGIARVASRLLPR